MLGYSDQVTQKHAAEVGNTWARYASAADRKHTPTKPSGRTMTTDTPGDRRSNDTNKSDRDIPEATLFDLEPPVRPYDIHLESLGAAATALNDARGAVQAAAVALDEARKTVQSAKEQLTRVVLQARQAGLSWSKIGETLGISPQSAYQRWVVRLRRSGDVTTSDS
jgi:hypothetical protein